MQSVFRALADPTRRDVLRLLRAGPMTSGELAAHFPTAWATVSRHLGVLREAGLVLAAREGQQVVYEVNTTVLHDVVDHVLAWVRPEPPAEPAPGGRSRAGAADGPADPRADAALLPPGRRASA